jgi:hypothetical protein
MTAADIDSAAAPATIVLEIELRILQPPRIGPRPIRKTEPKAMYEGPMPQVLGHSLIKKRRRGTVSEFLNRAPLQLLHDDE